MRKAFVIILFGLMASLSCAQDQLQPIRVGMLLPLQADALKRDKSMDRFVDFYSGALLAVYNIQKEGQPVEVYTYDVGRTTRGLQQLLDSSELDQVDMIIGPAYAQQVHIVANWALDHKIRVLLPFSSEVSELADNPYLMQFNPSSEIEANHITAFLNELPNVRCIFVESIGDEVPTSVRQLQRRMIDKKMEVTYTTLSAIIHDSLGYVMSDSKENVMLLNTERFSNVRSLMTYLSRANRIQSLILLSRYSWQVEPIVLPQIYSTIFKQFDLEALDAYQELYRYYFPECMPASRPRYDLLGYDIMSYVFTTLQAERDPFEEFNTIPALERIYTGIQSDIHFQRVSEEGGYINTQINVVYKE